MDVRQELSFIQKTIVSQAGEAATKSDLAGVANCGNAAKLCRTLIGELDVLEKRVEALKSTVGQSRMANGSAPNYRPYSSGSKVLSAKALGQKEREDWTSLIRQHGIELVGHGKRYRTKKQLEVGVAFANELPVHPDRWFLGMKDEHFDVVVLLCKSGQKTLDVVIPVQALSVAGGWNCLSRSRGGKEVKFHLQKNGTELLLLIPGKNPLRVTQYIGKYDVLR